MRWFVACSLVLIVAGVALAGEEILLNDGSALEGDIQTVDQKGITALVDGKTMSFEPGQLDVHFYYDEWAKRVQNSAEGHLRLAVFAFEQGLFNQARSQYRRAERLDKDLVRKFEEETVPKIKEGIADNLLSMAKQAVKNEDWDEARRLAAKILTRLEDTKAAQEARDTIASIQLWRVSKDEERLVRSLAQYLPKDEAKALETQKRVTDRLAPIENRMRKTQDLVTKGLRTKSNNRQKGIFETAARHYEDIIKDLDKLAAEASGDQALVAYVEELRKTAVRDGVDAWLQAGNVYLIRRSYEQALSVANAALQLDPDSSEAKRFQQEVLRGSQMRNGWWGRGR